MAEYLELVPWLKFLTVLVPLLIVLFEIRTDKKRKDRLHKIWLPILYSGAALVGCTIFWFDALAVHVAKSEAREWQMKAEKRHSDEMVEIRRIGGLMGNGDMTRQYVEAVQKLTNQFIADKTEAAVGKLFNTLDERKRIRTEVGQANQKLLTAALARAQPVCGFFLEKFDGWLREAEKRGVQVKAERFEFPPVGFENSGWHTIRVAKFTNDRAAEIQLYTATVEDGQVLGGVQLVLIFHSGSKSGQLMVFAIYNDSYSVQNNRPARFQFKDYTGTSQNPIGDSQLSKVLNQSLDEVMAFIIEDVTLGSQQAAP